MFNSISQCVSKPFSFESERGLNNKTESSRLSVSIKELAKINQVYIKYLIRFISDVSNLKLILESSLPLLADILILIKTNL